MHAFAALTGTPVEPARLAVPRHRRGPRVSDELPLVMAADDLDAAEGVLVDLGRDRDFRRARKGSGASFGKGVPRAHVQAAHQELVQQLDVFRVDADADLAALLRDELRGSIDEYERLKARHGALDFLDLLLRARNLVHDRDDVRRDFQERFDCLFVDEFQDTDPLQAEILLLLAAGRSGRARLDARPARPGQAVHRRRPEAVDLPLPPRRREHLSPGLRAA